ncbi:winged helix DNA-binding domain-containing protein [Cohnella lubricantis]|uniref:AlkZ family DNA glycosylase n=1 Tax=Cohnella lubricantis TaxID=2163172 RepID=A0A841TLE5_9BACL|nr:winged helix DNA-binding domain-containing protein [Cohnella lubricantis]MBB6679371.1 AlkZ family DNA glycosylase [Cohnella lubricantis]MBP2117453.1 hypothetical protein [Cohnella lubricantis]
MREMNIPCRRLLNQRIARDRFAKPEDVVRHLGAMQAQDYHQAVWAIASRTRGATLADVERAIEERRIVLSWPLRGTIHAVPPEELRTLLKLSASRKLSQQKRRLEQLGLTEEIVDRCGRLIEDELRGGGRMTREALMQLYEANGIRTEKERGYQIIWRLAQSGRICMGPREGKRQTFVLADEWLPADPGGVWDRGEELARLALRYYAGHGPASVRDLAWWAGLTLADAREATEAAAHGLTRLQAGDQELWEAADRSVDAGTSSVRPSSGRGLKASVHLLAGFDEYLLGYEDRSAVLPDAVAPSVAPGNNGMFMPMVVIGGRIAGVWKRTIKTKRFDVEFRLSVPSAQWEEALNREAERYGAFIGLPLGDAAFRPLEE